MTLETDTWVIAMSNSSDSVQVFRKAKSHGEVGNGACRHHSYQVFVALGLDPLDMAIALDFLIACCR